MVRKLKKIFVIKKHCFKMKGENLKSLRLLLNMYKKCKKSSLFTVYSWLICLVPSVVCDPDWSRLTYEQIYKNTSYAQLPQRPYPQSFNSQRASNHKYSLETMPQGNEVEQQFDNSKNEVSINDQLLVGFARDPYRYSVPHEDYVKGVRNINPQTYRNKGENRGKRGVLHLYNMIFCATGCEPLDYKGYGCYCGFLGSGRPTDGIDRCCKMHDDCYENMYCPFYTVYFQPYYWKCYHNQPLCALENYQTQHHVVNGCAARLCECDRQFAMCVKRYSCPRGRALCRSSPIRLLQNLLMFR